MKLFRGKHQEDQGGTATMTAEPETSPTTETAKAELEQIQHQITQIQSDRSRLEALASRMSARLMTIDAESNGLKQKLVSGDTTVTEILDRLDADRIMATRKRDGALAAVSTLQAQMVPLQRRTRELAMQADLERQDQAVAKFQETAQQLSKQIIDGWVKACRDAHELVITVEDAIHSGNLDDVHRSQVLAINERLNGIFLTEGLRPVNEGWLKRESHLFRRFSIQAARPR